MMIMKGPNTVTTATAEPTARHRTALRLLLLLMIWNPSNVVTKRLPGFKLISYRYDDRCARLGINQYVYFRLTNP